MDSSFHLFFIYIVFIGLIQTCSGTNANFIDLKFDLKLRHVPHECRKLQIASSNNVTSTSCTLPYSIALLEPSQKFDLQVISYESGVAHESGKKGNHYQDDTVIGISNHLKHAKINHEFVGIKFYGLPKLVQNYFIFDVSRLVRGKGHKVTSAVHSEDLSFKGVAKLGKVAQNRETGHHLNNLQLCTCQNYTCACCAHANIPKIRLNANCCVSLEYLYKDYGISFTISLNGHVIYNETVSARNPPPVCFNAPYLKDFASLCFHFYNMSLPDHGLSGCLKMEGRLYDVLVGELNLGCFHFGPWLQHRHAQKYGTMTVF